MKAGELDALIITHEHIDHVAGLAMFAKTEVCVPPRAALRNAAALSQKEPAFEGRLTAFERWGRPRCTISLRMMRRQRGLYWKTAGTVSGFATDLDFVRVCGDAAATAGFRRAREQSRSRARPVVPLCARSSASGQSSHLSNGLCGFAAFLADNGTRKLVLARIWRGRTTCRSCAAAKRRRAARTACVRCSLHREHMEHPVSFGRKNLTFSVRLICVGKLGEKFWADAVKEYTKRLAHIVN